MAQLFTFDGLIGRQTWWQHQIISVVLVFVLLPLLTEAISELFLYITPPPEDLVSQSVLTPKIYPTKAYLLTYPLAVLLGGLAIWIGFAATYKRVRHRGSHMMWTGLYVVVVTSNIFIVLLQESGWSTDKNPLSPTLIIAYINIVFTVWLVVFCGVLNGSPAKASESEEQER